MTDVRTSVAKRDADMEERQRNAARYLESLGPQIARVLPKHIPQERIVRIAITACRQNPTLTECAPLSLAGALMVASTLGLEVNTPTEEAFLVPYRNEATLIVGYQGFAKLVYQSGMVSLLDAQAVFPEDEFDYSKGTSPYIHHKPKLLARADNSQPVLFYATAELKTGATAFEVLTAAQVKTLRGGKVGPKGDIPDPMYWMERKTPVRQLVKLLPKSPLLALAAQVDEVDGTTLYRERVASQRADVAPDPADAARQLAEAPAAPVEDPPPGGDGL